MPGTSAKSYSSSCEINFKKVSKSFFLSSLLLYYEYRPPKPATQVASSKTHLERHFYPASREESGGLFVAQYCRGSASPGF
ncbi:Polysaccharide deacetylase protein [Pseudomonas cannabina]|uniref:Polysaccharide deacetylase family protein n=2 Tax=Pseudomonas syringae group TaxID=136849 RepID=A0A0P9P3U2_PSECA|nr:Polysaccharide deacetylase family protein [Pseudomonas cannabina pv. alisalensis]KPW78682.1 Polysaccharide deacetylase family protein [Pseudomonas syringae pv. coriandricola]KPW79008.1 Polysaccharide deacetylase family protein [Pseudomonas cannabina]RMN09438.1 Polysaccharide deacetylase protein [Pseudomonas syringae pv. coriandricola]RMN17727.1 Polysaccharide deacetylase protein [Pseudomonas cannabina]